MNSNLKRRRLAILIAIGYGLLPVTNHAQDSKGKPRLLQRIFNRDKQTDKDSDSALRLARPKTDEGPTSGRENDGYQRYPQIRGYNSLEKEANGDFEGLIDAIYAGYEWRIDQMDPPDLNAAKLAGMDQGTSRFDTAWRTAANKSVWGERTHRQTLDQTYIRTLAFSNQIKVFSDIPLIRETGMQEADGEFDITSFIDGRTIRTDEPVGSQLTTGRAGRFLENEDYFEGGVRKKFITGTEATLSNRLSTRSNNSDFLLPQNQGSSELVLSVVQPLLEGGGVKYNTSRIRVAKLDAQLASSEFVRQLQSHLLEVNRAYWGLYLSRANYLIRSDVVDQTGGILKKLEDRGDLDALESEVLRARASLAQRKASLNTAELAIRNNEERLRALINDPDFDIGSNAETIPVSTPEFGRYTGTLQEVAREALHNRPEIQQAFDQLRASVIRRDMQKNERKPSLNLIAELMLGDIEPNKNTSRAFQDQFGAGTSYVFGFSYEKPWDNDFDRARLLRREFELRQQSNQLKTTVDTVLLEALTTYRELMSSYRDMQGRYETLQASRQELNKLNDRLKVDAEGENGASTMSYQLQLILDSLERNQTAEEGFLTAVVNYNSSFAALERAKGTFLRHEDIQIERILDTDDTHPGRDIETLKVSKYGGDYSEGGKGGYGGGEGEAKNPISTGYRMSAAKPAPAPAPAPVAPAAPPVPEAPKVLAQTSDFKAPAPKPATVKTEAPKPPVIQQPKIELPTDQTPAPVPVPAPAPAPAPVKKAKKQGIGSFFKIQGRNKGGIREANHGVVETGPVQ